MYTLALYKSTPLQTTFLERIFMKSNTLYTFSLIFLFSTLPVFSMRPPQKRKISREINKDNFLCCNLSLIAADSSPRQAFTAAIWNPRKLLAQTSCMEKGKLWYHRKKLKKWSVEIGQSTTGRGNIVKKLLKKIKNELGIELSYSVCHNFVDIATDPQPHKDIIGLLQKHKKYEGSIIAFADHDPLEHSIYNNKMIEKHGISLSTLFDYKIILPFYNGTFSNNVSDSDISDDETESKSNQYCLQTQKYSYYEAGRCYIATQAARTAFLAHILETTYDQAKKIPIIDSLEELKKVITAD